MQKIINEGNLKKRITYIIITCRFITLLVLFLSWYFGKLIETQLYELMYCTLPLTVLYIVFTTKYILNHKRYFHPGNTVTKSYFTASYIPLVLLHLTEWVLVIFNEHFFDLNLEPLYWCIVTLECLLGAYAGYYLTDLFSNYAEGENSKTS
jgi:hypothetical protein